MSENNTGSIPHEETEKELERHAIYINLDGNRVVFDPEIPTNHKWFKGEYHTAAWGSDSSPFAGRPKDKVRISMMSKKLHPETHNSIASVYGVISAVKVPEDREFIGKYGWWMVEDLSHSDPKKSRKRGKV